MARVLRELHGKALYLHNAIFDLPRILRTFGVDLLEEDVRDTMVLSRILRAGQWEYVAAKNGGTATVEKKHNIRDVLVREIGERSTRRRITVGTNPSPKRGCAMLQMT